jgi:hypothetical protein
MEILMRSFPCGYVTTALVFILCSSAAVAVSSGIVRGQVSDSEGAVTQRAHLLFHPDTSGRSQSVPAADVVRETDAMGRFDVQLEPGFYDVCIMATAFTPECRKILVSKEEIVQHDARLKVDPLISQHLGDTL